MVQDNLISTVVLNLTETEPGSMNVNYYILCNEFGGDAPYGYEPHKGYGIEARLYNGDKLIDSCAVKDIACSQSKVLELIDLLSRNTVTPVTLRDVVEDYISA